MSFVDARGVPVSTRSSESLAKLETALDLSLSYFLDPLTQIDDALAAEPTFAMGHCLRAGMLLMTTNRNVAPMITASVAAVEALGTRANARERAHAAAARTWLNGDFAGSIRRYGDILLDYPRDLVALQIAHIGDFLHGSSTMLRDRVAQVLPFWEPGMPGYGYVLGMYAFGLEETALYSRAEDMGRRALEVNARDPWAVHAVTHVMEMQGRLRDGMEWLTGREQDWAPNNGFSYHNWWHLGLFHLDAGDTDAALDLYDRRVHPSPTPMPMELIDASALLWRLTLRGIDCGPRWERLAVAWESFCEDGYYAFNDVHAMLAFVGARRFDLATRTLAALELAATGRDTNAMMTRDVGLPVAHALASFGKGEYAEAVNVLLPVRTIANRFGGSHAQRDLIHLTMIEAALRAGHRKLARALAAERTQLKPTSPFNWLLTARALELNGDAAGAQKARESVETRRKAQFSNRRAVA
jgi:tetratricopeptide (TPR) repeat protein